MKKYLAIALALMATIACQKEPQINRNFTATAESYDETKTFTDASLQVKWSEKDYLAVWNSSSVADKYTVSASSVGKNTADLELVAAGQSTQSASKFSANIGCYPYAENISCVADGNGYKLSNINLPATQTYAEGSFGNGAVPMVAVTGGEDDHNLVFRNVCGVLRLTLSGEMTVKTISVTGNNNETLCGTAEVKASNTAVPAITMTGDGKTVTLDCGAGVQISAKTTFDIVLPPVTFEKGFTVKVNDRTCCSTSESKSIKRSQILCMDDKNVYSNDYLKFTSEGETRITLTKYGTPDDITLLYCKESEGAWKAYTIGNTIDLPDGESLLFKSGETGNATFSKDTDNCYCFTMEGTGKVKASGNIMSLLDADCNLLACPSNCFRKLFDHCDKLISAPDLPATTLASYCYMSMFQYCSGLQTAPALPAMTMATGCYRLMFQYCTGLQTAPALPATALALDCYRAMFQSCTSLTKAPVLPATTLAPYCYYYMFNKCTGLEAAPELPSTKLESGCYSFMFQYCSGLKKAPALPATALVSQCYRSMFQYCAGLQTAPELPATKLADSCYLYMFNKCTSLAAAPELPSTELAGSCYLCMFQNCTSLTKAPSLPATTLAARCYQQMFTGCSSLKSAPALPATTLAELCYYGLFKDCTALTSSPTLPAENLAKSCYYGLFYGCSSLKSAPALPATTLAEDCYDYMFSGCTSMTTAPALPATTLTVKCYECMFDGCTGLTKAPDLNATTLAEECYCAMFYGCSNIKYIKMMATDVSAAKCMSLWTYGVASTGTFVKNAAASWDVHGIDGIPEGWTVTTE